MNRLKNYVEQNSENFVLIAVPLTCALIICRAFPILSFFYYAVPLILILFFLFHLNQINNKELKIPFIFFVVFFGWAALTSVWSPFPRVSLTRAAYFLLISSASALLGLLWIKNKRNDLFEFLLPANLVVITVSIYSLITSLPSDAWTGGHGLGFKGFASHQNTLASAILFTIPGVVYPLLKEVFSISSFRLSKVRVLFFTVILILNIYLLIISVSRSGVLSIVIMIVAFFFFKLRLKERVLLLLLVISFFAVLIYSSQEVKEFVFKTEKNIGDRRIENIKETIIAAEYGGLFGIGYGVSKTPSSEKVIGYYAESGKLFVREKMISVLALLEEVGIIGCIVFISPIILVLVRLFRFKSRFDRMVNYKVRRSEEKEISKNITSLTNIEEKRNNAAFSIAVLIAFCFHAQIEAWWVGVGSIQLPLFFMVVGQAAHFSNWKFADENDG